MPPWLASPSGLLTRPNRVGVDLDEQMEQEDSRLGECGAPGRAKQRVCEVTPLSWRQQVEVYRQNSHGRLPPRRNSHLEIQAERQPELAPLKSALNVAYPSATAFSGWLRVDDGLSAGDEWRTSGRIGLPTRQLFEPIPLGAEAAAHRSDRGPERRADAGVVRTPAQPQATAESARHRAPSRRIRAAPLHAKGAVMAAPAQRNELLHAEVPIRPGKDLAAGRRAGRRPAGRRAP
jgi:hypothetical protein